MSKNGKIDPDGNNDRKDIEWFENYEKHSKTKHREKLKNEDIFNYIKDVEQNCRIEVSSGDEDYAGTKKSSNCSVRCSGTRFKSFKKVKSRITSRKNKSMTLKRERKRSSSYNATGTCNYCCSVRKSYFHGNSVRENSRRNLNTSTKSISQRPNLSRFSYNRESSPTLYGWYSRKNHKTWPAVTEVASLEVTDDWSQNAICDSRINRSNITDRKSATVHTFKSLRRRKLGDTCYMNICPSFPPNEKTERNSRYRNCKHREETRMRRLNQESGINNFENQQPLNKIYSSQDTMFSYQAPLQKGGYKGRYTSEYRYPLRRSRQPTSWGLSLQSNRLTSTRLPETNSLLQRQTLQWENEIGPPSKASSSIMGTSIDKGYQRGTNRKNNTDQQRRRPDNLGNRESCYHRPGLLRESGELYKVVPTHENKQWLGCYCEDVERDETTDCSKYCRCSENANDFIRLQRESTCRPVPMSKRVTYTAATFCKTLPKSVYSGGNDEGESEINSSMEEDSQNEDAVCDNHALDVFDDEVRTNNYDEALDLRDLKPHMSFLDDRARRGSSEVTRAYRKLSNDLKSSQREATEARTTLRRKITARYPAGKEFSFAIRTPGKPMSRDTSGLRYDAAKSTCDCKEPFHYPPAACSTGFCTCIENGENAERNNSDLSRKISDKNIYCCCCCSCSSSTSHDEKDPVKKLESFCERVKAVNQDIFHKPLKSTCSNTTKTNAQKYAYGASDEQNQSEFSTQGAIRRTRSIEREWLKNAACLRLEKSKLSHDGANLEKILIYPPRGESGPPLTLYKRSSNISCRVKGDADTGFRYSVTYVQKFISPTWMPGLSEVLSRETDKECDCSVDYG